MNVFKSSGSHSFCVFHFGERGRVNETFGRVWLSDLWENPLLCTKAHQTQHQTEVKWQGFVSTAELWFWEWTPITEV